MQCGDVWHIEDGVNTVVQKHCRLGADGVGTPSSGHWAECLPGSTCARFEIVNTEDSAQI
jgi:hypothetical protein